LLGNAAQGLTPILPISTAAFAADQVQRSGKIAALVLGDLLDAAQRTSIGLDAAAALLNVMEHAAGDAIAAGWAVFNPELAIKGLVQPQILGFPMGPATERVELILSKSGLSFAYQTSIIEMVKRSLDFMPGASQLATLITLGFSDRVELGFTLHFPDVGRFANLLARGSDNLGGLTDFIVDTINPFGKWEVLIHGELQMMGFRMASISGLIFGSQLDDNGNFLPSGLFGSRVVNLDPDGDGHPNPDLANSVAQIEGSIPVNTKAEYENMMRFGGIVLTGELFFPKILRDPVELFTHDVNWQLPERRSQQSIAAVAVAQAYQVWLNDFVGDLTQDDVWARLQITCRRLKSCSMSAIISVRRHKAHSVGGGANGDPAIQTTAKVRPLDAVLTAKITNIFNSAFVEGLSICSCSASTSSR
jgi:hypothetical protein